MYSVPVLNRLREAEAVQPAHPGYPRPAIRAIQGEFAILPRPDRENDIVMLF
jgi:hypothetical protein